MLVLLGGLGGLAYQKLHGCASGTCPITSSPLISTLYGALVGFVIGGIPQRRRDEPHAVEAENAREP